jgi:hypothetical protein
VGLLTQLSSRVLALPLFGLQGVPRPLLPDRDNQFVNKVPCDPRRLRRT